MARVAPVGRRRGTLSMRGVAIACTVTVLCASAWAPRASATSLVAVSLPGEFVLAADSRLLTARLLTTGILATGAESSKCKIHQARRCVFATTGAARATGLPTGVSFEASHLAAEACEVAADVDAIAAHFVTIARRPFIAMYRVTPPELRRHGRTLQAYFLARRAGRLAMLHTGLRMKGEHDAEVIPATEVLPGELKANREAMALFQLERPRDSIVEMVARIVELEGKVRPDVVGGPVSILRINTATGGAAWERPGVCPAIDRALLP